MDARVWIALQYCNNVLLDTSGKRSSQPRRELAIDLAMARPETGALLAEGWHVRAHARAGDLAALSDQHRAIRPRSARWNDVLVGFVGDRALDAGSGGNTGRDNIPFG